jgi:hypothetical protein
MTVANCSSCRFFNDIGGPIGLCRRFPLFQNKSKNDWCGEFATVVKEQQTEITMQVEGESEVKVRKPGRPKKEVKNDASE